MTFFKTLISSVLVLLLLIGVSLSDSHDKEQNIIEKAKEINQKVKQQQATGVTSSEEPLPLNDPFAGNEGTSSSASIPQDEQDNEMSLYNFKLAGLISGKDYSYISIVNTAGEVMTITLGQYLGKIQLVDLRLNEAIFKKEDETFIIIDFNNQIREANEY